MILYSKYFLKNYVGITLYPFIILDAKVKCTNKEKYIINHERIHFAQQKEMLVFLFYIVYLVNYLTNFVRYKKHRKAYRNIVFEREAYSNERNLNYLERRKKFAWTGYK